MPWTNFPQGISLTTSTGTAAGVITGQSCLLTANLAGASTALEAAYIPVPWSCTVRAAYGDIASGTVGSVGLVTLYLNDTAGTNMMSASFASTGTAGAETITIGTGGTTAVAAGSSIAVVKSSSGTAYGATISVEVLRT